jgi:hypothetical protein
VDQDAAWGRLIIFFNDHQKNKKESTNEMYSLVGLNSNNSRTRSHNIGGEKRLPKYDSQSETTIDSCL